MTKTIDDTRGLSQILVNSDPELIVKLTGSTYKDYDYGYSTGRDFRGHYTDEGKLPNHPTFSTESRYSSPSYMGGTWNQTGLSSYNYTPSGDMVRSGNTKGLLEYFRRVEPNSSVTPPVPYSDKVLK